MTGSVTETNFALGSYEKLQSGFQNEKRPKILGTSSGAKFEEQGMAKREVITFAPFVWTQGEIVSRNRAYVKRSRVKSFN